MNNLKLYPTSRMRGRIVLPASKSISNRALVINALSGSAFLPENLSDSDDTEVMLRALKTLSNSPLKGEKTGEDSVPPSEEGSVIDIGAAGTAMRFLTAYLSVTPGEHVPFSWMPCDSLGPTSHTWARKVSRRSASWERPDWKAVR